MEEERILRMIESPGEAREDYIVLGNGNIGSSFARLNSNRINLHIRETRNFPVLLDTIRETIRSASSKKTIVLNAVGAIDCRKLSVDELERVNYLFPLQLIKMAKTLNFKVVTLGTVMERFPLYCNEDRYLNSKLRFYEAMRELNLENHIHLQLHTIYGGASIPGNMFLGKLFKALASNSIFEMSDGLQLREYHHIDDVVDSIRICSHLATRGVVDLSSGKSIRLLDLALKLSSKMRKSHLIFPGIISRSIHENTKYCFDASSFLPHSQFREPIEGIFKYFSSGEWRVLS